MVVCLVAHCVVALCNKILKVLFLVLLQVEDDGDGEEVLPDSF